MVGVDVTELTVIFAPPLVTASPIPGVPGAGSNFPLTVGAAVVVLGAATVVVDSGAVSVFESLDPQPVSIKPATANTPTNVFFMGVSNQTAQNTQYL